MSAFNEDRCKSLLFYWEMLVDGGGGGEEDKKLHKQKWMGLCIH